MMIRLVGPGGAGKSTTGTLLAERLGVPFLDLDQEFSDTVGDISNFIDTRGYDAYAARNVDIYSSLKDRRCVVALSSGFLTYREDIHAGYVSHRRKIAIDSMTFVLIPSLDLEVCVAEIVRRQLTRPFSRSAEREEQVIRARFGVHLGLQAKKVVTMRPVAEIVDELLVAIAAHEGRLIDAS